MAGPPKVSRQVAHATLCSRPYGRGLSCLVGDTRTDDIEGMAGGAEAPAPGLLAGGWAGGPAAIAPEGAAPGCKSGGWRR